MTIGPSDGVISLEGIQDVAVKGPGATNNKAKADWEDSTPDLSSSDSIKHHKMDQQNHSAATGCMICRGGVRDVEITGL